MLPPKTTRVAQAISGEDFLRIFEALPTPCLLLAPGLEIVAATQAFLADTRVLRSEIIGRSVLDVFADTPDEACTASRVQLEASLAYVRSSGRADQVPLQRYALHQAATQGGTLEAHHWGVLNTPVLDANGRVIFLLLQFDPRSPFHPLATARQAQQAAHAAAADTQSPSAHAGTGEGGPKTRLLIVDDTENDREYFKALFPSSDYLVLEAADGEAALELVRREKPDLVLTDLLMPKLDGFELIRRIRSEPEIAATRIMVWSANVHAQGARILGESLGANRILLKPVEAQQLHAAVNEVLGQPAQAKAIDTKAVATLDFAYRHLLAMNDALHKKRLALEREIEKRQHLEEELRRSERRSAGILATATDAVITTDRDQRIEIFNSAAEAMFGCSAASAIGSPVERFIPPRFRAAHDAYFRQFIAGDDTTGAMGPSRALVGLRANGEEFPMEASIAKVLSDGDLLATVVIRDVSVRHATDAALQKSAERLRLVQLIGRTGIFDWDILANTMQWSAEIAALYGLPAVAFESQYDAWRERVHPQDLPTVEQRIRESLHNGIFEGEWRVLWPDGSEHWLAGRSIVYKNASGQAVRMLGVNIDIGERKEHEERLRRMAQHDALTGLPNRTLLYAFAERLVSAKRRVQDQSAFLFIDLDRFKQVNDRYGHDAGDGVLKEVARRLAACMRAEDLVGRLGGDEFVAVLAPIRSEEVAAKIALHALDSLGQPYLVAGHELQVTPSIGISLFPQHGSSVDELIKHADAAMYVAKQRGCNNVQFYQHAFDARSEETQRIGERLHQALELHEFELYLQPVVDLATGKPVAAETLVRWPSMAVPPARFLPASEAAGLMPALGVWILQEAARLWQHWRALGIGAFPITVNLSESQLRQPDFLQNLAQVMEDYGMQGEDLELEITEGILAHHLDETLALLHRIREKKVLLTLDDFGAACSSMDHLTQWPLNVVKLDQSIVQHLGHDCKSALIAESVIGMATALKLSVVATGIESQEALDFLKSHHCHFGQGFFICHPLPAPEFETWCLNVVTGAD